MPLHCPPPLSFSTGTKWSGEISLRNGTSYIVAGDFSTQSINRTQTICRQNRHATPLEMTVERGCTCAILFLQRCLYTARRPCHFDRSEAKWRNLTPKWYNPHGGRRFLDSEYQWRIKPLPSYQRAAPLEMTVERTAPVPFCFFQRCLYTARRPCHFDRSEVEWRNLTPK